jgi:hypothetical protein
MKKDQPVEPALVRLGSVYIPPDVAELLKADAKKDDRTMARQVTSILKHYYQRSND